MDNNNDIAKKEKKIDQNTSEVKALNVNLLRSTLTSLLVQRPWHKIHSNPEYMGVSRHIRGGGRDDGGKKKK